MTRLNQSHLDTQYYFAERALLASGWASNVLFSVKDGQFHSIDADSTPTIDSQRLSGPVLPTMANVHSHAFQRVMAGAAEVSLNPNDSFWSWRDLMYKIVQKLTPDDARIIATQLYIDMLKAGYSQVGEFHYLHHDIGGHQYGQLGEMSNQMIAAADESGIGLTLLPVLYSHSAFGGQAPNAGQARFINSTDSYLALHQEVKDCINWSGQRPVEWLNNEIGLSDRWCLVHATHLDDKELHAIATSNAIAGLCPTTEANLGDGIFPAVEFEKANGRWAIGSDSHVSLSIVEELRTLEYGQRLRDQQRNRLHRPDQNSIGDNLFQQALLGGNQACDVSLGLAQGNRADFMVLDNSNPFVAASESKDLLNRWLFATNDNVVKDVFVAGKHAIKNFKHEHDEVSRHAFIQVIKKVMYDV